MPRVSFLFWNINRRPLTRLICELAWNYEVDVLMLAECEIDYVELLLALNADVALYHLPLTTPNRVRFFTRFSTDFLAPLLDGARYSIRRLNLPEYPDVLLVTAHLISKLHASGESQAFETVPLARAIADAEDTAGHRRTMLVGDLNMNPFEPGLVAAAGLNAVMTQSLSSRGSRTVQGSEYRMFYNPMWSRLGDRSPGPPGTYYQWRSEHVTYFWNMFDQVLLRPELATRLADGDPQILSSTGHTSLVLDDGRPDGDEASDHLPVFFRLEL